MPKEKKAAASADVKAELAEEIVAAGQRLAKESELAETYGERTVASMQAQAEARGIIWEEEKAGILLLCEERFGKELEELTPRELRNLNMQLPAILTDYLDGSKRR